MTRARNANDDYKCRQGGYACTSDLPDATHVYDCVRGAMPVNPFPARLERPGILRTIYGGEFTVIIVVQNPSPELDLAIHDYYGQWFDDILCVPLP